MAGILVLTLVEEQKEMTVIYIIIPNFHGVRIFMLTLHSLMIGY